MKERPILFSAPMVRAILSGAKTQTRRVVKPQPRFDWFPIQRMTEIHRADKHTGELNPDDVAGWGFCDDDGLNGHVCPYGKPGDRLWVRERHAFVADGFMALRAGVVYADGTTIMHGDAPQLIGQTVYNSDKPEVWKWRPSIHMPRWASRILLEVTDVRVERVQEISTDDIYAEGVGSPCNGCHSFEDRRFHASAVTRQWIELWDSINAGRGYGWDVNPWVWVVSFRRVDA